MPEPLSLLAFARLSLRLSEAGEGRDRVLAEAGLTEEAWEAEEARWSSALEEAESTHGDAEGVPPLVEAYAEAFSQAQTDLQPTAPLSFDGYVAVTRALQRGEAVTEILEREGLSLSAYLASHRHWTKAMTTDHHLARRFAEILARS